MQKQDKRVYTGARAKARLKKRVGNKLKVPPSYSPRSNSIIQWKRDRERKTFFTAVSRKTNVIVVDPLSHYESVELLDNRREKKIDENQKSSKSKVLDKKIGVILLRKRIECTFNCDEFESCANGFMLASSLIEQIIFDWSRQQQKQTSQLCSERPCEWTAPIIQLEDDRMQRFGLLLR